MLECHACLRRCLTALLSSQRTPLPSIASKRTILSPPSSSPLSFHTAAPGQQQAPGNQHNASYQALPLWASHRRTAVAPRNRTAELGHTLEDVAKEDYAPVPVPRTWGQLEGRARAMQVKAAHRKPRDEKRLHNVPLQMELRYLKDPLKLADHVKRLLDVDDAEKAQALVWLSSKAMMNTVSWNHLINWQMQHGMTKAAFETYNDMKKRGQRPDNYTYTIILRGLADYAHHPQSLGKALSVYHGMFGPNSKITPNITHVNAVLKVCARANDTNSMWDIVSKLPEKGPLAADCWTFSTIFNHMQYQAVNNVPAGGETMEDVRETTIVKGRQMWGIMVARWRSGDLKLDEDVMCTMGRLLLIGTRPRDWDDVLSLVSQTTQIPRLVPKLGSVTKSPLEPVQNLASGLKSGDSQHIQRESSAGSEFNHVDLAVPSSSSTRTRGYAGSPFYIRPGNLTLTIIMEALYRLSNKAAAVHYWNLLTSSDSWGITPDNGSVHMYLRVLRIARASTDSVNLITDDLPRWGIRPVPGLLKIAMRTCLRDKNSPHAMDNAMTLLQVMNQMLPEPDFEVLEIFFVLASGNNNADTLCRVLDSLDPVTVGLRSMLNFGPVEGSYLRDDTANVRGPLNAQEFSTAIQVLQGVISCYDRVLRPQRETKITGVGVAQDREKQQRYEEKRRTLAAFVSRFKGTARQSSDEAAVKPWGPGLRNQAVTKSWGPGPRRAAARSGSLDNREHRIVVDRRNHIVDGRMADADEPPGEGTHQAEGEAKNGPRPAPQQSSASATFPTRPGGMRFRSQGERPGKEENAWPKGPTARTLSKGQVY